LADEPAEKRARVNLAVIAAVFPVIFLGELPDKTMFASLVMAIRGRPVAVWLGATAAFAVHVVIAITLGVLLIHILPHRAVELAVALTFFAGAGFALYEAVRGGEDESEAEPAPAALRGRRTTATTFGLIFLAEWGDLTQILTANLAAKYHDPISVGVGAVLGLWSVALLAILGGKTLLKVLPIKWITRIAALVMIALAGYSLASAIRA
jgi:putative Ca2+/H+ antiporter (TMEM165/GDT1 family)